MPDSIRYIKHRINSIEALLDMPTTFGAEVDVRYHDNDLILDHDPFGHASRRTATLENYLDAYSHGMLILNLKTEGIEYACIEAVAKHGVKDWCFLDMSMPYFVKYANNSTILGISPKNLMVRFSEFEPIEYALSFKDKVKFVWVDCFTKLPLDHVAYLTLKKASFEIVIVSPELHGHSLDRITEFSDIMMRNSIMPYAICTKRVDLWQKSFGI